MTLRFTGRFDFEAMLLCYSCHEDIHCLQNGNWYTYGSLRAWRQTIRQVIESAPDMIPVPLELRHKRLELILWPLEETQQADRVSSPPLEFRTLRVNHVVMPSREERYER